MAETKKTFPMLPVSHWWALRKKFKQSIPGVVTNSYLATVLEMGVESARANVLPFLRVLGIIDEDGKTTERAKLWRDDGHYSEVCKAILKEAYPTELLEAVTNPRENRDAVKRWFANHTGVGDAACGRMAALYTVLVDADPSAASDAQKPVAPAKSKKSTTPKRVADPVVHPKAEHPPTPAHDTSSHAHGPDVSLNVQIHISADASADQIEQIFAAMAKHIYKRS